MSDSPMDPQSNPEPPTALSNQAQQRQRASHLAQTLRQELQKVLIGQDTVIP